MELTGEDGKVTELAPEFPFLPPGQPLTGGGPLAWRPGISSNSMGSVLLFWSLGRYENRGGSSGDHNLAQKLSLGFSQAGKFGLIPMTITLGTGVAWLGLVSLTYGFPG